MYTHLHRYSSYPTYPDAHSVFSYIPSTHGQATDIFHTDDAGTKLSDRVRRKCFNCSAVETSTWRRSSLSPGKVLCNKCGLYERTHSRPRPEKFTHKHKMVAAALTTKPHQSSSTYRSVPRIPSISDVQIPLPPRQYNHPSLGPFVQRASSFHSQSSQGSYSQSISGVSRGSPVDICNILNETSQDSVATEARLTSEPTYGSSLSAAMSSPLGGLHRPSYSLSASHHAICDPR